MIVGGVDGLAAVEHGREEREAVPLDWRYERADGSGSKEGDNTHQKEAQKPKEAIGRARSRPCAQTHRVVGAVVRRLEQTLEEQVRLDHSVASKVVVHVKESAGAVEEDVLLDGVLAGDGGEHCARMPSTT